MIKSILLATTIAFALPLSACKDTANTVESSSSVAMAELINPNTASFADMIAAGVSEPVANAVLENRPFADGKAFAMFATDNGAADALNIVFIPMGLNATPEADFKLIPGVGDKMAHEFEEYRPYTDMAQFDREIAKYVDAEELARLRRYVYVD